MFETCRGGTCNDSEREWRCSGSYVLSAKCGMCFHFQFQSAASCQAGGASPSFMSWDRCCVVRRRGGKGGRQRHERERHAHTRRERDVGRVQKKD
eukprot:scaffold3821_cov134-Isochrysis_galbana.AAC.3